MPTQTKKKKKIPKEWRAVQKETIEYCDWALNYIAMMKEVASKNPAGAFWAKTELAYCARCQCKNHKKIKDAKDAFLWWT